MELVVVIILLSILSATALSRFGRPDIFAPSVLAANLTAQIHFAAQAAQTRSTPVNLDVSPTGGRLLMQVATSGVVLRSVEPQLANVTLSLRNAGADYPIDVDDVWQMTFTGKGDLVAASIDVDLLDNEAGITAVFRGDSDRVLCIQPIGYVSEQAC